MSDECPHETPRNEAFASVVLARTKETRVPHARVNVDGSAIVLDQANDMMLEVLT